MYITTYKIWESFKAHRLKGPHSITVWARNKAGQSTLMETKLKAVFIKGSDLAITTSEYDVGTAVA